MLSRFATVPAARTRVLSSLAAAVLRPGSPVAPPAKPVQIRGRPFLPDGANPRFPEFMASAREEFPKVFSAQGDLSIPEWGGVTRELMDEYLHQYGVILLRGLPLQGSADFGLFMKAVGWRLKDKTAYLRAIQARSMTSTVVNDAVRTASDDHRNYTIEPHNEFHTVGCPRYITLYCETPAEEGGEWPTGDSRAILAQLDPEVVAKFERLGARYTVFYEHKDNAFYNCWQGNVAPTKEACEKYLKALNYEFKWHEDGALSYWQNFPAIRVHPKTGERVWFNQIHAHHETFYKGAHPLFVDKPAEFDRYPVHTTYGDGTPMEREVLDHIREVIWKNCVAVPTQAGDVIVYDNWLAKHGRMGSFGDGPARKVYVSVGFD
mmetsp:Transcript_44080/g.108617  ORF Transcript_44080/g.108617 Transcript_44080/m.108617 type:complete len:377 (-) Transcript_44080:112-1242(-)